MKKKMRLRLDYDNCRLFDDKIEPEKFDDFVQKVKKKLG